MYRIGEWVRVGNGTKAKVILLGNLGPKIKIEHLNGVKEWVCLDQVEEICPFCDIDRNSRKSGEDFYPVGDCLPEERPEVCISPSLVSFNALLTVTSVLGYPSEYGDALAVSEEFIINFCPMCGRNLEEVGSHVSD